MRTYLLADYNAELVARTSRLTFAVSECCLLEQWWDSLHRLPILLLRNACFYYAI